MKKIVVVALVLLSISGKAQISNTELLTNHKWKMKSSGMAGIGIHKPLPKGSELTFSKDGKWKSSAPWENFSEGTWEVLNEGRTLRIQFPNQTERDFRIDKLTESELRCESKKLAAVYVDTWVAAL